MLIIEGEHLYHHIENQINFYFLINDQQELLAYVASKKSINGYDSLIRLEKLVKTDGLITLIIIGLVSSGKKFIIEKDEELTYFGLEWLCKSIKSNRHGLKITDQNGNLVDVSDLRKEWYINWDSKNQSISNIAVLIENLNINSSKLIEDSKNWKSVKAKKTLLMPYVHWKGDKDLL